MTTLVKSITFVQNLLKLQPGKYILDGYIQASIEKYMESATIWINTYDIPITLSEALDRILTKGYINSGEGDIVLGGSIRFRYRYQEDGNISIQIPSGFLYKFSKDIRCQMKPNSLSNTEYIVDPKTLFIYVLSVVNGSCSFMRNGIFYTFGYSASLDSYYRWYSMTVIETIKSVDYWLIPKGCKYENLLHQHIRDLYGLLYCDIDYTPMEQYQIIKLIETKITIDPCSLVVSYLW